MPWVYLDVSCAYCLYCVPFTLIAAVLLFMMQYMLLHRNTTFEVLSVKHQWDVKEKAECCRNAGIFYLCVTFTLCTLKFLQAYHIWRWLQNFCSRLCRSWCCPWRWRYYKLRDYDNDMNSRSNTSDNTSAYMNSNHNSYTYNERYHSTSNASSRRQVHSQSTHEHRGQYKKLPWTTKQLHQRLQCTSPNEEVRECLLQHITNSNNNNDNNHDIINTECNNGKVCAEAIASTNNNIDTNKHVRFSELFSSERSSSSSSSDSESEEEMTEAHVCYAENAPFIHDVACMNIDVREDDNNLSKNNNNNIVSVNSNNNITMEKREETLTKSNFEGDEEEFNEDNENEEPIAVLPYFLHNARSISCDANYSTILKPINVTRSNATTGNKNNNSVSQNSKNTMHTANKANTLNTSTMFSNTNNLLQARQASLQLSSLNPLALTPFEMHNSYSAQMIEHTSTSDGGNNTISDNSQMERSKKYVNRRWRRSAWFNDDSEHETTTHGS